MSDFIQIIVSRPGQFRDGLISGNPDAVVVFEGVDIPFDFDEQAPTLVVDSKTREPRLMVVMASGPFEMAMLGPGDTLESVTLNQVRAAFEFFAASGSASPLCTYVGFIPGGVGKVFVRAFEELPELDSNDV